MSLNDVVSAERLHIGFFGLRNAGKSSLVNAVTGQDLAVVSPVKGTTTDPVKKAMELLPLGPVVIIDTPGLDDEGELGALRVKKATEILSSIDVAVLVHDAALPLCELEQSLLSSLSERKIPVICAYNKADLLAEVPEAKENALYLSALTGSGVQELKEALADLGRAARLAQRRIVADLLSEGDMVVLVIPIDESAPKGRLILPQQQTIRDVLDAHCSVVCCQVEELSRTLGALSAPPAMVITDSQAFGRVSRLVPDEIPLTSFSILFARYKGELETLVRGAAKLSALQDGDKVLISEGCTHHRQCNDIGAVKIPKALAKLSGGKKLNFVFSSGATFSLRESAKVALVVHCGGCMLTRREMQRRIAAAREAGVPITNYGLVLAAANGIEADPATCMVRRR